MHDLNNWPIGVEAVVAGGAFAVVDVHYFGDDDDRAARAALVEAAGSPHIDKRPMTVLVQ
jgi:hypothetical protein